MSIEFSVGIIGLGYVGLPLAVEFSNVAKVIGFDIDTRRINELRNGKDSTLEVDNQSLIKASELTFTDQLEDIKNCNFYIVTVPTPVNEFMQPDLSALIRASESVGKVISPGDYVVFESTVYPGATEDECVPVIEKVSGLKLNQDFYVGYSPERINPGDHERRLPDIKKVTSGSTPEAARIIDDVYRMVIRAGTYCAPTIRVAEAAKVIENTQRDLNIALVNELAIIFSRMGIDTQSVLDAAGTKWNFLPFKPGLVGGHCIGVDPYYLTQKAESVGYHPHVILAGRRLNEGMGVFVAEQLVKAMIQRNIAVNGARVLVLGLSFKENCPDLRNTRVVDVIRTLESYCVDIDVHDPWVDQKDVENEFDIKIIDKPGLGCYDAVLVAVAHQQFIALGASGIRDFCKPKSVLYDLKSIFQQDESDLRL